jgi:hypothetical protein
VQKRKRKSFILALSYPKIISATMMVGVGVLIIIFPTKAEGKVEIATNILKVLNFLVLLFLSVIKTSDRIKDSNRLYERMIIVSMKV